jgi:hypothetical protein
LNFAFLKQVFITSMENISFVIFVFGNFSLSFYVAASVVFVWRTTLYVVTALWAAVEGHGKRGKEAMSLTTTPLQCLIFCNMFRF